MAWSLSRTYVVVGGLVSTTSACVALLMPFLCSIASAIQRGMVEVQRKRSQPHSCAASDATRLLARGGGSTRFVASAKGELALEGTSYLVAESPRGGLRTEYFCEGLSRFSDIDGQYLGPLPPLEICFLLLTYPLGRRRRTPGQLAAMGMRRMSSPVGRRRSSSTRRGCAPG
ncbi:uncharacterized protein SCHCODRAFT_02310576 [Schizophyllum commune H4-8]|uniref:uncharacterized protein n=1 Tax=Schizophyllum commune (strain H4-8 / FGSC 9210) TaxID=578458 RepID=UPI00215EF141|nr:uncharacterized protein SCHCODRAFT_02310576 [Schizophyllum commune H4-8]KAI5891095.1 hypothetical protein SCHCODRAFT_02310576 [Schizophyllum commune H4-8]